MKQDIKDEWVKRLRSGEYKQGFGYLRRTDEGVPKYCCLGVLCEMAVEAGVIPPAQAELCGDIWAYGNNEGGTDDISLPSVVREWAGLTSGCGLVIGGTVNALTDANDSEHMPFSDIADIIEKHEIK